MERWSFVQQRSGAWLWRRIGSLRAGQSRSRFSTLVAAMDDAERNGLVPGKSRLGSIIRRAGRLRFSVAALLVSTAPSLMTLCAQGQTVV